MAKNSKRSRSVSSPSTEIINEQQQQKQNNQASGSSSNQVQIRKKRKVSTQNSSKKQKVTRQNRKKRNVNKIADLQPAVEENEYLESDEEDDEADDDNAVDREEVEEIVLPTKRTAKAVDNVESEPKFVGEPVTPEEALRRWPHRYQKKSDQPGCSNGSSGNDDSEEKMYASQHYLQAEVDGFIYNLDDEAYVQAEDGVPNYICKIREFFKGDDGQLYFTAQWFYRAEDTIIKNCSQLIEPKRVFFSEIRDDNPLGCLVQKLNIIRLPHDINAEMLKIKTSGCDFYYDLMYVLPFSSFVSLPPENVESNSENDVPGPSENVILSARDNNSELTLLDLYAGCGAMSTGLSLGANSGGVKLTTKWAVDFTKYACESLSLNHPETKVRNEPAKDFFLLLKEWERLCVAISLYESAVDPHPFLEQLRNVVEEEESGDEAEDDNVVDNSGVYEVEDIMDICYGDVNSTGQKELYFKIRWKNYDEKFDTWEPIDCVSDCPKKVKEFVTRGFEKMILPLPGQVDVICGGPPCQGISGYNRYRNKEKPLDDEKNQQLIVFMEIIDHLKPRFILMENVVDILKFSSGYLARHAFGSLVKMKYQARLGMMTAGAYGLPQYRRRIFLWGALKHEKLPGYPLPTHHVMNRGVAPKEFEANLVDYKEGENVQLKRDLKLRDAISDLPEVPDDEGRDEMLYSDNPTTDFQRFIKQLRGEMPGSFPHGRVPEQHLLNDHRPLQMSTDDYQRACKIPKKKGANFRDLEGVLVGPDNKAYLDPTIDRVFLPSKKPLVPDYAISYKKGTSRKPFGRLWHDEIVSTVMTRAEPHNHRLLHPEQDRVLTVRENARLQGFPDYYKLKGPMKERYIQVGNAVAFPVACALGYTLALTLRGLANDEPVYRLPEDYPFFTAEGSEDEPQA